MCGRNSIKSVIKCGISIFMSDTLIAGSSGRNKFEVQNDRKIRNTLCVDDDGA